MSSSIGKHFRWEHSLAPKDLNKNFKILKKCKNKFDCHEEPSKRREFLPLVFIVNCIKKPLLINTVYTQNEHLFKT